MGDIKYQVHVLEGYNSGWLNYHLVIMPAQLSCGFMTSIITLHELIPRDPKGKTVNKKNLKDWISSIPTLTVVFQYSHSQ